MTALFLSKRELRLFLVLVGGVRENRLQFRCWDGQHDGVSYRLDEPDGQLKRCGAEQAAGSTDLLGDRFIQFDLERADRPGGSVEKQCGDFADRLAVGGDDCSSSKLFIRNRHCRTAFMRNLDSSLPRSNAPSVHLCLLQNDKPACEPEADFRLDVTAAGDKYNPQWKCREEIAKMQDSATVVRRFVDEVITQGDIDRAGEFVWDDVVEQVPFPGQGPGLDGLKDILRGMRAAFPDLIFSIEEQITEGDRVASRFEWTGTHEGAFLGVPATGRSVRVWGIVIDRLEEGRIKDTRIIMDTLGLMMQLGVVPPPKA